jgi:hypothetical protein
MSKTLAESAAEILKASMGAPKDPMPAMAADVEDLGGSSNENPAGDAIGAVVAAKAKMAPKPGQTGAPAEPIKKGAPPAEQVIDEKGLVKEEDEVELTEEELDAYLDSLSEEELEVLANEFDNEDSETIDEVSRMVGAGRVPGKDWVMPKGGPKKSGGIAGHQTAATGKAPKPMNVREMVSQNMGSMKEDVDALFNGESLSEEFREKATTIFEAAVKSRVETVLEQVIAKNQEYLEEATVAISDDLTEKVDEYLNYVVDQWMEENKLAVNSGLRAELSEDFIDGLKNLFTEHYIEIPENKVDVVDELADKVLGLESALEEASNNMEALISELNEAKKNNSINNFCEGLTQVQKEKMRSLAEGVEFTTEGDFVKKLALIRESYFPTKSNVKIEEKKILSETSEENSEVETGSVMDYYVKAISKTVPKTGE